MIVKFRNTAMGDETIFFEVLGSGNTSLSVLAKLFLLADIGYKLREGLQWKSFSLRHEEKRL
jgi:hypothetical protein